jgi:hypothetical protein
MIRTTTTTTVICISGLNRIGKRKEIIKKEKKNNVTTVA